jgi:hypothetical protein
VAFRCCSLFPTAIRPTATLGPCHLHLPQPFFLQLCRGERAFLFLISEVTGYVCPAAARSCAFASPSWSDKLGPGERRASVPTISYSRSDFEDCARRACCARKTASSASTRFFSSSVSTALFRGDGMSWTAGKAGAVRGRFGASCGMPPAETGNCAILAHEAREPAPADTSANPSKKWENRH